MPPPQLPDAEAGQANASAGTRNIAADTIGDASFMASYLEPAAAAPQPALLRCARVRGRDGDLVAGVGVLHRLQVERCERFFHRCRTQSRRASVSQGSS